MEIRKCCHLGLTITELARCRAGVPSLHREGTSFAHKNMKGERWELRQQREAVALCILDSVILALRIGNRFLSRQNVPRASSL